MRVDRRSTVVSLDTPDFGPSLQIFESDLCLHRLIVELTGIRRLAAIVVGIDRCKLPLGFAE
jgi:hypothetical protein